MQVESMIYMQAGIAKELSIYAKPQQDDDIDIRDCHKYHIFQKLCDEQFTLLIAKLKACKEIMQAIAN